MDDQGPADELLSEDEVFLENHEDDPDDGVMHTPWTIPPPSSDGLHVESSPSGLPFVNSRTRVADGRDLLDVSVDLEPIAPDYMNDDWPQARPFQEDGHLAADEVGRDDAA